MRLRKFRQGRGQINTERERERDCDEERESITARYWLDQIKGKTKLNINFCGVTAGTLVYGTGEVSPANQSCTRGTRDPVVLLTCVCFSAACRWHGSENSRPQFPAWTQFILNRLLSLSPFL